LKVFDNIQGLRDELAAARSGGREIEFVPTMGAFHEGHLKLMRAARESGGLVVVSIFVNPLQFGPSEDFESYPRDPEADRAMARAEGVDILFAPSVGEMYPDGEIETRVDPGRLGRVLEGEHRPGHLTGVATVCAKLFNIVGPDRVFMGRKDAQQVAVLQQIVRELNLPLEVVPCPTVREESGLAMSSRNRRLSPEDRKEAAALYTALHAAAASGSSSSSELLAAARRVLDRHPAVRVQYLEVVDPRIVAAAYVGSVRLIDNCIVGTAWRPERKEEQ
jgi:pantoate--beta-alanine ligase